MPKAFIEYLDQHNLYICKKCKNHLSCLSELISKAYRSQHGTAYLFNRVVNVVDGKKERRKMTSGYHTVCDIFCHQCQTRQAIGWKYIEAEQLSQKFKEGRFILSESCILKENWIDD